MRKETPEEVDKQGIIEWESAMWKTCRIDQGERVTLTGISRSARSEAEGGGGIARASNDVSWQAQ